MKFILYPTIFYILFEAFKLVMQNKYWKWNLNRKYHPVLVTVESLYFVYIITLFFVSWVIAATIIVVSGITAFQVAEGVIKRMEMNKKIRQALIADGIVSIFVMSYLIIKII